MPRRTEKSLPFKLAFGFIAVILVLFWVFVVAGLWERFKGYHFHRDDRLPRFQNPRTGRYDLLAPCEVVAPLAVVAAILWLPFYGAVTVVVLAAALLGWSLRERLLAAAVTPAVMVGGLIAAFWWVVDKLVAGLVMAINGIAGAADWVLGR